MLARLFIAIAVFLPASSALGLPAFPGAEGYGSDTVGGRDGAVYIVDTLSDDSADGLTFRDAVTATGPRYVVFSVSGNINLTSKLTIANPYLTIAGQTSPGGICITGHRTAVNTHDVIITHMRFRIGDHGPGEAEKSRSFEVYGDGMYYPNAGYNIIVDHCSFSWAADTNVTVSSQAYDITFSWNIISDPLDQSGHPQSPHGYGFLYWGSYTDDTPVKKYSLHHNYFAHCPGRVPDINGHGHLDSVNNVVFDSEGGKSPHVQVDAAGNGPTANFIHNYFKKGSSNNSTMYDARLYSNALGYNPSAYGNGQPHIYMEGCLGAQRASQSDPEWSVGAYYSATMLDTSWRSSTPIYPSQSTATAMTEAYAESILTSAGATRPARDSVDQNAVDDFSSGTSGWTNGSDITYPTSFPTFTGTAPIDADADGMSDAWEIATWGSTTPTATGDEDGDGYNNLEAYLHHLGGYFESSSPQITNLGPSGSQSCP